MLKKITGIFLVLVMLAEMITLEQAAERFNSNGQIPYYVEISTGIWEFYCEPQTDINELMNKSDELLYEAKKNRRAQR